MSEQLSMAERLRRIRDLEGTTWERDGKRRRIVRVSEDAGYARW